MGPGLLLPLAWVRLCRPKRQCLWVWARRLREQGWFCPSRRKCPGGTRLRQTRWRSLKEGDFFYYIISFYILVSLGWREGRIYTTTYWFVFYYSPLIRICRRDRYTQIPPFSSANCIFLALRAASVGYPKPPMSRADSKSGCAIASDHAQPQPFVLYLSPSDLNTGEKITITKISKNPSKKKKIFLYFVSKRSDHIYQLLPKIPTPILHRHKQYALPLALVNWTKAPQLSSL